MSYQIILFDLDDTLIDFAASETISLRTIYERFYHPIEYAVFEHVYKQINTALWQRVGHTQSPLMPSDVRFLRFQQLNEALECTVAAEVVAKEYDHLLGEHADWIADVKSAVEFLHRKGHILGIITNGLSDAQGKKRQRLGLHNWFDCFVVSDEVGIAKPNKEIFTVALQEIANKRNQSVHSYNKQSILMVGDSLLSDGCGASNFGIHYCHINTAATKIEPDPRITYHLNSVAQLPECIGYKVLSQKEW